MCLCFLLDEKAGAYVSGTVDLLPVNLLGFYVLSFFFFFFFPFSTVFWLGLNTFDFNFECNHICIVFQG